MSEQLLPEHVAVLAKPVHGRLATWRRGLKVTARKHTDGTYVLERLRPIGKGNLPLLNVIVNVPASALRFMKGGAL